MAANDWVAGVVSGVSTGATILGGFWALGVTRDKKTRDATNHLIELLQSSNTQLKEERDDLQAENMALNVRIAALEDRVGQLETHQLEVIRDFANAGTCLRAPLCTTRILVEGDSDDRIHH